MERWAPGSHGGTYGGNAVACAAAVATIRVIREEGLLENAQRMGALLLSRLRELQREFPVIGDVRGLGLMVAAEFTAADGTPASAVAREVIGRCLERRLLLLTCGTYDNIVRWMPPLVVTDEQVETAVGVFRDALKAR